LLGNATDPKSRPENAKAIIKDDLLIISPHSLGLQLFTPAVMLDANIRRLTVSGPAG
jgi:hypothetical protein